MWVCQIVIGAGQLAVHLRGTLLGGDGLQRINNFMLFALLMPLLALLQNVHIRVLLVLIRFPVFDLLEHAVLIPLKGTRGGGVQQRDDIGIVVADGVETVDPGVVGSGKMQLSSVATSKRGSPQLRKALFQVVSTYVKRKPENEAVYQFYAKKRDEGKPFFVCTTAAANKFLRIYYARVKECLNAAESATQVEEG